MTAWIVDPAGSTVRSRAGYGRSSMRHSKATLIADRQLTKTRLQPVAGGTSQIMVQNAADSLELRRGDNNSPNASSSRTKAITAKLTAGN
jgi:hypothetical protein